MTSARDVIRRSPHRMVGAITLPRVSHNSIAWESRLELDAIVQLAACQDVRSIKSQPFKLEYTDSAGDSRTYFPDLLVETKTSELVVEVKPLAKLLEPDNLNRFTSIRSHLLERGLQFEPLTEEELHAEPRRSKEGLNNS